VGSLHCRFVYPTRECTQLAATVSELASKGLRVIALACALVADSADSGGAHAMAPTANSTSACAEGTRKAIEGAGDGDSSFSDSCSAGDGNGGGNGDSGGDAEDVDSCSPVWSQLLPPSVAAALCSEAVSAKAPFGVDDLDALTTTAVVKAAAISNGVEVESSDYLGARLLPGMTLAGVIGLMDPPREGVGVSV
jgi:hypothetical protein